MSALKIATRRSRGPLLGGIWLHIRTRGIAAELDRRLASGTDPMQSDELSLRVGQLGSATTRVRLAAALQEAVQIANGHHAPLTTTRLRRPEIQESAELLVALSERLRSGESLGVQGLAMTARLVHDRCSPLYRCGPSGALPGAVLEALAALECGQRTASIPEYRATTRQP
jgi:hypothetical protein